MRTIPPSTPPGSAFRATLMIVDPAREQWLPGPLASGAHETVWYGLIGQLCINGDEGKPVGHTVGAQTREVVHSQSPMVLREDVARRGKTF